MTNATNTVSILFDFPDNPSETVTSTLLETILSGGIEVVAGTSYTLTLDASGTGTETLPTPDGDGTLSALYGFRYPSGQYAQYAISWSAGTQNFSDIVAANITSSSSDVIITALAGKVAISGDTMTGALLFSGTDHGGLALVSLTAAQRDALVSPATGAIIWNTTSGNIEQYDGTAWDGLEAASLQIQVRNDSGGALTAGTPIYITGYNVGQDLVTVDAADATSAATMPAVGLILHDIDNNGNGLVVVLGKVPNVNTGSFSVGDELYVSETAGALTVTKPTGTARVQKVATVLRSNANFGILEVNVGPSAEFVLISGDSMTGDLNMGGNEIQNYTEQVVTASPGATYQVNGDIGGVFVLTTTENLTISFTNITAGRGVTVIIIYGGNHTIAVSGVEWPNATPGTFSETTGARDKFVVSSYNGSVLDAELVGIGYG